MAIPVPVRTGSSSGYVHVGTFNVHAPHTYRNVHKHPGRRTPHGNKRPQPTATMQPCYRKQVQTVTQHYSSILMRKHFLIKNYRSLLLLACPPCAGGVGVVSTRGVLDKAGRAATTASLLPARPACPCLPAFFFNRSIQRPNSCGQTDHVVWVPVTVAQRHRQRQGACDANDLRLAGSNRRSGDRPRPQCTWYTKKSSATTITTEASSTAYRWPPPRHRIYLRKATPRCSKQ